MGAMTVWRGTLDEYHELMACVERLNAAQKWSILSDQRMLDGLVFVRRRFEDYRAAEWSSARSWPRSERM